MNIATVTITNEPLLDFLCLEDGQLLQVFRADVLSADRQEKHLVICAGVHSLSQTACTTINRTLRQAGAEETISFEIACRVGESEVIAGLDREFNAFSVAAVVGVSKAQFGWDESQLMVIKINGVEIKIRPYFDSKNWIATEMTE